MDPNKNLRCHNRRVLDLGLREQSRRRMSAIGVKRTWRLHGEMSAYDPRQILLFPRFLDASIRVSRVNKSQLQGVQ